MNLRSKWIVALFVGLGFLGSIIYLINGGIERVINERLFYAHFGLTPPLSKQEGNKMQSFITTEIKVMRMQYEYAADTLLSVNKSLEAEYTNQEKEEFFKSKLIIQQQMISLENRLESAKKSAQYFGFSVESPKEQDENIVPSF